MRGRSPIQSLAASPTMVGAITTLIVIVAVFLAYNANQGLPFVPVYRVSVEVPNAARLVDNNEVRIGGNRVGVVESIEAVELDEQGEGEGADEPLADGGAQGSVGARLNLKLDKSAEPIPQDSRFRVRYRSSFGLKYLEITRGSAEGAPEGFVFDEPQSFIEQTEFDDINNTFDAETRENSRTNLVGFGDAFAGRGVSLNVTIENLDPLFRNLEPVAGVLSRPATRLRRFFPELGDAARIVAPVAEVQAQLFTNMAITFAAISEDPAALQETISEGVPTLETGLRVLPRQRPFLRDFTTLSRELRPGVADLRPTLPVLNDAIEIGTPVLERTPQTNRDLERVFRALDDLVEQPATKVTLQRLKKTFADARVLSEHVTPAQTVCNYWNYWFTGLPEHLSERDQVGYAQRNSVVGWPGGPQNIGTPFGNFQVGGEQKGPMVGYTGLQSQAIAGQDPNPADEGVFKPYELAIAHGNPYGPTGQRGVDGGEDCQPGQTGLALGELRIPGQGRDNPAVAVSNLPGSRGPTSQFFKQDSTRVSKDTRVESRQP